MKMTLETFACYVLPIAIAVIGLMAGLVFELIYVLVH